MSLLNKFIITGIHTVEPRPKHSYKSEEDAINQAKVFMQNKDYKGTGIIIWKPYKVLKFKEQPIQEFSVEEALNQEPKEEDEISN